MKTKKNLLKIATIGLATTGLAATPIVLTSCSSTRDQNLAPTSLQIIGDDAITAEAGKYNSRQYSIETTPSNANNNVDWSLQVNPSSNSISINERGLLSWDNAITANTYSITITAASKLDANVTASKMVTLTITPSIPPFEPNPISSSDYELGFKIGGYIPDVVTYQQGVYEYNIPVSTLIANPNNVWLTFWFWNKSTNQLESLDVASNYQHIDVIGQVSEISTNIQGNVFIGLPTASNSNIDGEYRFDTVNQDWVGKYYQFRLTIPNQSDILGTGELAASFKFNFVA